MIEIQCTSCHTCYRIDERVLPDETPTFKCSRCGHVFSAEATPARPRREQSKAAPEPEPPPPEPPSPEPPAPEPEPPEAAAPDPQPPAFRAEAEPISERTVAERGAARGRGATAPAPAAEQFLAKLHRDFARGDEPGHGGENLAFDFNDEATAPPDAGDDSVSMPAPDDDWQVGDTPSRLDEPIARLITRPGRRRGGAAPAPQFSAPTAQPRMSERQFRPEAAAYFEAQGNEHSSAAFIGLFFLVAIGFGALSLVLCGEPQASVRTLATMPVLKRHFQMPILPATMVAVSGVRTSYHKIKGGHVALVITGTARNVGPLPLHAIQISVDLLDGQQGELAGQTTWCGNTLAAAMIGEMTPHELEFLERLEPQAGFVLDRSKEAEFELVFVDPPAGVANLRVAVTRADPAGAPAPGA